MTGAKAASSKSLELEPHLAGGRKKRREERIENHSREIAKSPSHALNAHCSLPI